LSLLFKGYPAQAKASRSGHIDQGWLAREEGAGSSSSFPSSDPNTCPHANERQGWNPAKPQFYAKHRVDLRIITIPGKLQIFMNRLSKNKRELILSSLVEGMSIRAASRVCDVSKNTVLKLLSDAGSLCQDLHNSLVKNLRCTRIQCDEIWSFVGMKAKNVPPDRKSDAEIGDIWTWTALDADTKLIVSYLVGHRDVPCAHAFMNDVASRVSNRIQLTTDGFKAYLEAVEEAFGHDVDYAMLVKLYGEEEKKEASGYKHVRCTGADKRSVAGSPSSEYISTSYVERQNLTMRMCIRRFSRHTNAFSKKLLNHKHAVALHFMNYNFCRIHKSLGVTPAMEAGVASGPWSIGDIVDRLIRREDEVEARLGPRTKRSSKRPTTIDRGR